MTAIEVTDLSVFAGDQRLLGPVSFCLSASDTMVIMGETGAGKSLVAQAILGTLPAALHMRGAIAINGRRVDDLDLARRAAMWGREIATLPQEPWLALDPLMASWRQVAESHAHVGDLTPKAAKDATATSLTSLGLAAAEPRLPGQLSGGMAQRVAFAAATAGGAPILLADEPTKGLDRSRRDKVVDLLKRAPETGGALLAITHEAHVARALGGKILMLRDGDLIEEGRTLDVLASPKADFTKALLSADPAKWGKSQPKPRSREVLAATDLTVGRGRKPLIENFNLVLHEGEKVAITGPSGVGKSTLLDALASIVKPFAGSIRRSSDIGAHAVQKLYQDPPAVFARHISLGTTLRYVARLHGVPWKAVLTRCSALHLSPDLLGRKPDAVSGGELQRISLVRALIPHPRVLLADEPTSRLDPITQRETMALIADVATQEGIAVVLVTHDEDIASAWAERSLSLS